MSLTPEKDETKKSGADVLPGSETADVVEVLANIPYIDPEKERAIVRKFDWLVLPQFVTILVLA
jgi:hypothetical protein